MGIDNSSDFDNAKNKLIQCYILIYVCACMCGVYVRVYVCACARVCVCVHVCLYVRVCVQLVASLDLLCAFTCAFVE